MFVSHVDLDLHTTYDVLTGSNSVEHHSRARQSSTFCRAYPSSQCPQNYCCDKDKIWHKWLGLGKEPTCKIRYFVITVYFFPCRWNITFRTFAHKATDEIAWPILTDGSDQDYPRYRSTGIIRHGDSTVRKSILARPVARFDSTPTSPSAQLTAAA